MINNILYQNPILTGFHADPSICRVGKDFYLAVSSFLYFPGIPIYHSYDLLHWEQIGNAINRNNYINLDGMKETGGIWAPTLRFYNGLFYLTAAVEGYYRFGLYQDCKGGYRILVQICIEDITSTAAVLPWPQAVVQLGIRAHRERYYFYYNKDKELTSLTTRYLANEVVGRSFTGTMAGVYAENKENITDGYAVAGQFQMTY